MTGQDFATSQWVERLNGCLKDLVDYERWVEQQFSLMRHEVQRHFGLPGDAPPNWTDNIRERISRYSLHYGRQELEHSKYQQEVFEKLTKTWNVLLEHPSIAQAACMRDRPPDGEWVLGLDLGTSRVDGHQIIFLLQGLVDYAVQHSPETAADAFAQTIQRGNDQDLTSYSILPFMGLHVDGKRDIARGLSVISFEEARQYITSDFVVRSLVAEGSDFRQKPIAAVVWEVKWGPVFFPVGFAFENDWPERPETFRDDALMLVDLLAVTHESAVISPGWTTKGVDRRVEHLVGRNPFSFRTFGGQNSIEALKSGAASPSVSMEGLAECTELFSRMSNDDPRLRSALSRLAASLSRSGPLAAFDSIVDVAIALEILYQAGAEQTYRYGTRAAYFLEETTHGRKDVFDAVKKLYDTRSSIVHGRRRRDDDQSFQDAFQRGFDIARRTLSKLVVEGGPSESSDWDDLVITGGLK